MVNIDLMLNIVSTIVMPAIALFFAWRGLKAWQVDKITNIHSNIANVVEKILHFDYNNNEEEALNLYIRLLDELEILALLIKRQYLFIDNKLKKQIFNTYVKNYYESEGIQNIIKEKRKTHSNAYCYLEKLYEKWNK